MHAQSVRATICNHLVNVWKMHHRKFVCVCVCVCVCYMTCTCIYISKKYPAANGPPVDRRCEQCGSTFKV